jgi:hypothetical protein
MSNALAIAAVTATMEAILGVGVHADSDLADTALTALPPDKARGALTTNQLNLFLYQVLPNATWRNMDLVKPGETGFSPLALNLYYLLTVFGRENDHTQPFDHHLLGKAMSLLYDHALLGPDEIVLTFPGSDLERQVDRVRITLQPLTIEEISKLWTGFATQYRMSVAYEVSVVLIESTQSARAPLPVLTRGPKDQGPVSQGNLIPPFPAITSITYPNQQTSARLGDIVTIAGNLLDGTNIGIVFMHAVWTDSVELAPNLGATASQLTVTIPPLPAAWPSGTYAVTVFVQKTGEPYRRSTNQLSLTVAPSMTITPLKTPAASVTFTVTCSPEVWPQQKVTLLIGDQVLPAQPITVPSTTLTFTVTLTPGLYYVRLRVDGTDSILVDRTVNPPAFDTTQSVTIT